MINLTSKIKIRFYFSANSNKQAQRLEKFSKIQGKKFLRLVFFPSVQKSGAKNDTKCLTRLPLLARKS